MTELPVPEFYDPANAEHWSYRPDEQALFRHALEWRERFGIAPASQDDVVVRLQLTDLQKDFCFPDGALYVGGRSGRGAVEDNDRTARFVYRNLSIITEITCTLDTHYPYQIFFPSFWLTDEGTPPTAHREVTAEEVRSGRLRPNPALAAWLAGGDYGWLERHARFYCEQLERAGKYTLYLWPPHCMLGSEGHALVGVIYEARMFHAFARLARDWIEPKGGHALSEHYSALSPEVLFGPDEKRIAERNDRFAERLLEADALIIAGQAASHCVKSTIEDLLAEILSTDPSLARKVYILEDCMSAVTVPDADAPEGFLYDFTPQAEEALARFAAAGMHIVRSEVPMTSWPDFPL
jgi:nicotinamidase-related amidase